MGEKSFLTTLLCSLDKVTGGVNEGKRGDVKKPFYSVCHRLLW